MTEFLFDYTWLPSFSIVRRSCYNTSPCNCIEILNAISGLQAYPLLLVNNDFTTRNAAEKDIPFFQHYVQLQVTTLYMYKFV